MASFLDPLEASLFKSCKNMDLIVLSDLTSKSIQASLKVTVYEASIFVDADSTVVKCLVLSRQGDGCRIEAQVRSLFIPSVVMFSRLSS